MVKIHFRYSGKSSTKNVQFNLNFSCLILFAVVFFSLWEHGPELEFLSSRLGF